MLSTVAATVGIWLSFRSLTASTPGRDSIRAAPAVWRNSSVQLKSTNSRPPFKMGGSPTRAPLASSAPSSHAEVDSDLGWKLALLANSISRDAHVAFRARVTARGCHNRRQPVAPPVPGAFMLGAPKCGTTDVFFRTRNMPWTVQGATKESQWFDFACFESVGEFSGGVPPLTAQGNIGCPPPGKTPQEWGRPPNYETGTRNVKYEPVVHTAAGGAIQQGIFPPMRGGHSYLHNCTAWHYQKFFDSGTYDCTRTHAESVKHPLKFSASGLWPTLNPSDRGEGQQQRQHHNVSTPAFVRKNPLWFQPANKHDAHFEGWRVHMDWTARTLAMEDGAAMAAHVSPLTRFIYMHRHPTDRMWSQFQHLRSGTHGLAHAPISPGLFHARLQQEIGFWSDLKPALLKSVDAFLTALHKALATAHEVATESLQDLFAKWCLQECKTGSLAQAHAAEHCSSSRAAACRGLLQAHWSISSHLLEVALISTNSSWSHAWHMPPNASPSLDQSLGRQSRPAFRKAYLAAGSSKSWKTSADQLNSAQTMFDLAWRNAIRALQLRASYEKDWFDDWMLLARSLFAAQHIRLLGVMPANDILSIQSEEYFRDPRSVLTMLQAWLCVPISKAPCQAKHPYLKYSRNGPRHERTQHGDLNSKAALPVQARPSHRNGQVSPQTVALLEAWFAKPIEQHARLLGLLDGSLSAASAKSCLNTVHSMCRLQWQSMPVWEALSFHSRGALLDLQSEQGTGTASWAQDSRCVQAILQRPSCAMLVGPVSVRAGLQFQAAADKTESVIDDTAQQQLRHRFDLSAWNATLATPGLAARKRHNSEIQLGIDYLNTVLGTTDQRVPQGDTISPATSPLHSEESVLAGTTWDDCMDL